MFENLVICFKKRRKKMSNKRDFVSYGLVFLAYVCLSGCHLTDTGSQTKLFNLLSSSVTGIDFANDVQYTEHLNAYTFRNFYNGGGVGIGDVNNDGLPDIFFCGNLKSNKLYLNKGNFIFEDITDKAGLNSEGVWSTGISFADVNGDGLLDIYVCKSGDFKSKNRSNALYINNGNNTFTDSAKEYGLNNMGLSTHAEFFDYDHDGDLDCYLLNNSFRSVGNYDLIKDQRKISDTLGGNKLYRNDNNHFTDVTSKAGIYSSKIGFGLGVTIADVNKLVIIAVLNVRLVFIPILKITFCFNPGFSFRKHVGYIDIGISIVINICNIGTHRIHTQLSDTVFQ